MLDTFRSFSCPFTLDIPASNTAYREVRTPSEKLVHIEFDYLVADAKGLVVELIEDAMITPGTVEIPIYNRYRANENIPFTRIYQDPAYISGGTIIDREYASVDITTRGVVLEHEWILKPESSYLYCFSNSAASGAKIYARLIFCEFNII